MHIAPGTTHKWRSLIGFVILICIAIFTSGCGIASASALFGQNQELFDMGPPAFKGSSLQTIEQVTLGDHELIFMSADGAVPNVPLTVLTKEIEADTQLAGQTMSSQVDDLQSGNPLEAVAELQAKKRHYIVFSSNKAVFDQFSIAAAGRIVPAGWGFTEATNDPAATATFLRVPVAGEVSSMPSSPDTEMCQLILHLKATQTSVDRYRAMIAAAGIQVTDEAVHKTLDPKAQEIYCNSLGRAGYAARTGLPYQAYLQQLPDSIVPVGQSTVKALTIDEQTYHTLALLS